MEGSKTFSKDFMKRHNIPTAAYENFSDFDKASQYLKSVGHNVVIKATGLAAGKGVIILQTQEEAQQALKEIMVDKQFGSAGAEVVIEEFLEGDELSILSFAMETRSSRCRPRRTTSGLEKGIRASTPAAWAATLPRGSQRPELIRQIQAEVLQRTVDGMREEGFPMRGCLLPG